MIAVVIFVNSYVTVRYSGKPGSLETPLKKNPLINKVGSSCPTLAQVVQFLIIEVAFAPSICFVIKNILAIGKGMSLTKEGGWGVEEARTKLTYS